MRFPRWARFALLALTLGAIVIGALSAALTASNTVPTSNLLAQQNDPTLVTIAPASCAALALTVLLKGNGNLTGTNSAELILGGPAAQTINGKGGNDCILGGDGNDAITGGAGSDVCLGEGGVDTFTACEVQVQ